MFTRTKKFLSIIIMAAMLTTTVAGAAFAQDVTITPGNGPSTALQPSAGMVTIAPNSWQWYIFRSQVPVNVDSDGNDVVTRLEDATINATLRAQSGTVDFEVWSKDDLNNWVNSKDFDPMGTGTTNEFISGDPLFWKGSFVVNDNYYLIVMNSGPEAATYALDIAGNVGFPSDMALDSMMPSIMNDESVMSSGEMALTVDLPVEATTVDLATTMPTAGYGPETALMPAVGNVMIAPNSWQWYSFRTQLPVNVDADGNDIVTNPEDATVQAALRIQSGDVNFEIWSQNDLNNWYNSKDIDGLGMGTENEFLSGNPLFWKGSFKGNDVYYLIVQNDSAQPAYYSLDISGNVSFPSALMLPVK
jgi:hypothetical protein